jgi:hypothetical protein
MVDQTLDQWEAGRRTARAVERSGRAWEWFFGWHGFEGMDRAAHFRRQADHTRQLADATHKGDLEGLLRLLTKDYDEVADDIETGAPVIATLRFSMGDRPITDAGVSRPDRVLDC